MKLALLLGSVVLSLTQACGGINKVAPTARSSEPVDAASSAVTVSNAVHTTPVWTSARAIRCKDSRGRDRRLCDYVIPEADKEDQDTFDAFEITASQVDLNQDGVTEVIVWESSWAGTSGGSLWILSVDNGQYKALFEDDSAWTPILVLPSEHHGWRDVAYLETGGGVETVFITVGHDEKSYVDESGRDPDQPTGEIVIDKKWDDTPFGPAN